MIRVLRSGAEYDFRILPKERTVELTDPQCIFWFNEGSQSVNSTELRCGKIK